MQQHLLPTQALSKLAAQLPSPAMDQATRLRACWLIHCVLGAAAAEPLEQRPGSAFSATHALLHAAVNSLAVLLESGVAERVVAGREAMMELAGAAGRQGAVPLPKVGGRHGSLPKTFTPACLHPTPCTLHTSSLHPTPCTLRPAACTLLPAPYNQQPAPYSPRPTTSSLPPTPRTLQPAACNPTTCGSSASTRLG